MECACVRKWWYATFGTSTGRLLTLARSLATHALLWPRAAQGPGRGHVWRSSACQRQRQSLHIQVRCKPGDAARGGQAGGEQGREHKRQKAQVVSTGHTARDCRFHVLTATSIGGRGCTEKSKVEIKQELECPICYQLMVCSHGLLCGHTFCGPCIFNWLRSSRKHTCPICREQVRGPPYPSLVLDKLVQQHAEVHPRKIRDELAFA
eukprot:scaffold1369_cov396-Prasinococcus_capsulatus_cf.AAC.4